MLIRFMLDVAVGMHYIAEKGLVHRVRLETDYVYVAILCIIIGFQ